MKIKSIEPHLLSCPLPEPVVYPFHGGERTIYKRDAMVVRINTDAGLVSYVANKKEGEKKSKRR